MDKSQIIYNAKDVPSQQQPNVQYVPVVVPLENQQQSLQQVEPVSVQIQAAAVPVVQPQVVPQELAPMQPPQVEAVPAPGVAELAPASVILASSSDPEAPAAVTADTRDKSVDGNHLPHPGDVVRDPGKDTSDAMSVTDSDAGHLEGEGKSKERKRTKKERKRTNLGPRIKVLRLVTGEELEETESVEMDEAAKSGVKVECQMETSKQKTVTFEFHTTDIVPEEMASTFINEDLLAEEHRTILVEQLHDIVTQLANNPDQLPTVSFPPEECFSPTRDKRDPSSEAAKTEHQPQPPAEPQHQPQPQEPPQAAQPPVRGTEKPPEKVKRFQISPVVENKPIVPTTFPVTPGSSIVSVDKRDNSTITVAGAKIDTATSPTTPAYVENKTKLEKLEMNRPMTISASSGLTTTLSPGAEQQQVTKPALVMSASTHSQAQVSPGSAGARLCRPFS